MTKLILSGHSRHAHWTRFKEEITTLMRSNIVPAKIVSTNEVIGLVQNDGYSAWQELLSRYYPCPDDLNIKKLLPHDCSPFKLRGWDLIKNAIDPDLCKQAIRFYEQDPEASSYHSATKEKSEIISTISRELRRVIHEWFNSSSADSEVQIIPWRLHYYHLANSEQSLSNKWHYDSEVSSNNFFAILYLNDADGFGTGIYDFHVSRSISQEHGYLGWPVEARASSLQFYERSSWYTTPYTANAIAGDILIFCPSMCLHKGIVPMNLNDKGRHNLHLSACFAPSSIIAESERLDSTSALSMNWETPSGHEYPPYYMA